MAVSNTRGNMPRQEPWPTEDIVEVVHNAIVDLMEADLEKQHVDPKYASQPEAAVLFNIVHHHVNATGEQFALTENLNRERNRHDLVAGLDELTTYIRDHAHEFWQWGRLPDHHATPVIEVVPNPFYLDRLAYLCLAVAHEFTERGNNALGTLRRFGLEVDGTSGDLDSAWLESGTAQEHLYSAIRAIEQIMDHPLEGEQKQEDTIPPRLMSYDQIKLHPDLRFNCPHCAKMTERRSPFCAHCGLQAREIIPAWDEPLDGVGAPENRIDIRPEETRLAGDLRLHFDTSGNLTEIEQPNGPDADTLVYNRWVIGEHRFHEIKAWPVVAKEIARYEAEHEGGPIVANCQVCGADIHDTFQRDLSCPNGCDQLKGDRVTCGGCDAVVPGIFNHCPACGDSLDEAPVFVD